MKKEYLKNEFPKKYKKQIIRFTERYIELARPQKLMVSLKKTLPVNIVWESDDKVRVSDDYYFDVYDSDDIKKYNEKIKKFIEETRKFGKKYFNESDWLWYNVLWEFQPENGEKFNFKKIKWV